MIPLDEVQRCFREWLSFYNRDSKRWHRLSQDEIDELTYMHWEILKKSIIGEIENEKSPRNCTVCNTPVYGFSWYDKNPTRKDASPIHEECYRKLYFSGNEDD